MALPDESNLTLLAEKLGALLKRKGCVLTLAESCTGGMVASAITSIAGSSAWFDRGFVTYSNAAKIDLLEVSSQTLAKFGAVSAETAAEMAIGALAHSQADLSGSITGIAGPDGGTAEKPVGTVCFGWVGKNIPASTCTQYFEGDRARVRNHAAAFMLKELIKRAELMP